MMLQIQDVGDGAPLHPHVSACYVGCGHDRPVECKVDGLAAIHVLVDAGTILPWATTLRPLGDVSFPNRRTTQSSRNGVSPQPYASLRSLRQRSTS